MDASATEPKQSSPKKKILIRIIVLLIILAAIATGLYYYFRDQRVYPSTDDAYVHAHILNIAPQISGQIENVYIKNMQHVKKGQLLFTIKPHRFEVALEQAQAELALAERGAKSDYTAISVAQANVSELKAHLKDTEGNTQRILELATKGFASKQDALNARTQLTDAKAQLAHAKNLLTQAIISAGKKGIQNAGVRKALADVHQAQLNMSYTKIHAPVQGTIVNFRLRPNGWVTQGRTFFSLIEHGDWWVDANYKETQLANLKVGMAAKITIDMIPGKTFNGYVGNISRGSGAAFSLLPPENASGNWVKVTRRFPVRVYFLNLPSNIKLRVGASSVVTVDTTKMLKDHETPHA